MTDEQTPTVEAAALERIARRVGIFHMRAAYAKRDYEGVQATAQEAFAQIRRRGVPQQEITLPDGRKAGLISIEKGAKVITVDEDELLVVAAVNDPADIEDYIDPAALIDPRVLDLLRAAMPHLVKCRIKREAREAYDKEIAENDGRVFSTLTGERETVATVTQLEATGKYSVRWNGKGQILLQEAVDAGLIGLDGDTQDEAAETTAASGVPVAQANADQAPAGSAAEPDSPPPDSPAPQAALFPAPPADDVKARIDRIVDGGRAPKHKPTAEQEAIIDAVAEMDGNLVVQAGAGTGKTTTLQQAAQVTKASGYYLVFNAENAKEARVKFPRSVRVMTTCGLAMSAVGGPYKHRLRAGKVPAKRVAEILRIIHPVAIDGRLLAPQQQARLVNAMVKAFLISDATEIGDQHVPDKAGLTTPAAKRELGRLLLPFARKAWEDLRTADGQLEFTHDCYVKMWQLSSPQLPCDYLLLDEAQDTNPVVLAVLNNQASTLLRVVGDSNQAIYEWRGAVDALSYFDGRQLQLSQSFRFGDAIADEANKWLAVLDSPLRLRGLDSIRSVRCELEQADAILCRTNATAISEAMRLLDAGDKVGVVGKMAGELRWLADAAADLMAHRPTTHPDLMAFSSWAEVQDHAENDPNGSDLEVMVKLVDEHGPDKIRAYIDRLVPADAAQTVVATAHRTKGLEWPSVRIAGDFRPPSRDPRFPDLDPVIPADMARLAYVAVTRAQQYLDAGSLHWVNDFVPDGGEQS